MLLLTGTGACSHPSETPQSPLPRSTTSAAAAGEIVANIDPGCGNVFQDKDNNYWFSGDGKGVYRDDGKVTTRYTTKDGLPSDQVGEIQQHATTGDIVLVTSNGFSRFDGRTFRSLNVEDPSKSEWKLQADDLWFPAGQDTGAVYRYDGKVMHRLTFPKTAAGDAATLPRDKYPNAKYSPYDVYVIYKDSKGRVWFGTAILGVCRYDGKSFAWFAKPAEALGSFGTRSIIEDKYGKFWFSSTLNRYAVDADAQAADEAGKTVDMKYRAEPGIGSGEDPFSVYMSAVKDKHGDLWLVTLGGGVFKYDGTKMTQYAVKREDNEPMMWGVSIYRDRQDNMWLVSPKQGLYKINGDVFEKFKGRKPTASAVAGEVVPDIGPSCWVIFQDKDDNYWFGSDGNGVFRFDGKVITRFTTKDGLAHDHIRGIQQHGPTGDILITTNGGVSKFDGKKFTTLPAIEMKPPGELGSPMPGVLTNGAANEGWVLNADDVWMSGSGGPRRYDGKTLSQLKFPKSPLEDELGARYGHSAKNWSSYDVWTVYKDRQGHMWFGTAVFGIARFDGQHIDWMFEAFLTEFEGGAWFGFRAIIEDRNGDFWFNSSRYRYKVQPHGVAGQEAGKLKYTREKGMDWSAVDTTDESIFFQSATQDTNGELWMAPYAGGVWRHDGLKGTHYPMKSGDEEITMFFIFKDNHGGLWVGTHEYGAWKFTGEKFERFKP